MIVYLGSHDESKLFYYSDIDKFILGNKSNVTYEINTNGTLNYFHDKELHFFVKTFKADYIEIESKRGETYYELVNRLYMSRILESI